MTAAGVDFACSDHLSLAAHPALREAALTALDAYGTAAREQAWFGSGSLPLLRLEECLAAILACSEAVGFATSRAAAFAAIRVASREDDHVLLDCLAAGNLQQAARAATRNVHRMPHGSAEAMAARVAHLRAASPRAGLLVVAETVLHPDAVVPDLGLLHAACRRHGATLLIRLGHDFGTIGESGLGQLARHGLVGKVDLLVGSFSGVLASSGGFVAAREPGLRAALPRGAGSLAGTVVLSPVQAAVSLAALAILASAEGRERRRRLSGNVAVLRAGLTSRGFAVLGEPGCLVPVVLGPTGAARRMTAAARRAGAAVNLLEHPAVGRGGARWPLLVAADHAPAQIEWFAGMAAAARDAALRRTARGTPHPPTQDETGDI